MIIGINFREGNFQKRKQLAAAREATVQHAFGKRHKGRGGYSYLVCAIYH